MHFIFFAFIAAAYAQPPHHCDNLTDLIAKNLEEFGTAGVFNTTSYPDAFKDLVSLHIPSIVIDGVRGVAKMALHPQGPDHYITGLWVYDNRGRMLTCRKINSSETAAIEFRVPTHIGSIRVYEHCNLHGVWEAPSVEIHCNDLRRLIENNTQYGKPGIYNKTYFPDAFKDLVGLHVPTVTIAADKKSGTVTLASHPMVEAHHITDIWVLDQRGNQIACDILHANDTATLAFNIEDHVTEIYAIEHCNLHGVWMADPVTL